MRCIDRAVVVALVLLVQSGTQVFAAGGHTSAPETGALLGAHVARERRPAHADKQAGIEALEERLGRRLDVDHHFREFLAPEGVIGPLERWDVEYGRTPMVSWSGHDTEEIVAGAHDDWVRMQANAVGRLDSPVLIRWGWEMESGRNARWVVSAEHYVAAWRHLRRLFAEEGATNAEWVWCPQAISFGGGAEPYYPGDEHVDWLCADGYNFAPGMPGATWRPFARIFSDFYRWAAPRGKPLMVAETGAQERAPGEKAEWIRRADEVLRKDMPAIKALVWFDTHARYDWRLDTSQEAFDAFAELARHPYWNQRVPLPGDAGDGERSLGGFPPAVWLGAATAAGLLAAVLLVRRVARSDDS